MVPTETLINSWEVSISKCCRNSYIVILLTNWVALKHWRGSTKDEKWEKIYKGKL